jgi:DNA-binding response OmpR family regulator
MNMMTDLEQPVGRRRILIVDDIEDNRVLLERGLTSGGYATESADCGQQAIAMITRSKPDLVLLDWMMPGLSGLDTLCSIREMYDSIRLPIIMCTAIGEDSSIVKALHAGANDYIVKPISLPILKARILVHLKQQAIVGSMEVEKASAEQRLDDQTRILLARRAKNTDGSPLGERPGDEKKW